MLAEKELSGPPPPPEEVGVGEGVPACWQLDLAPKTDKNPKHSWVGVFQPKFGVETDPKKLPKFFRLFFTQPSFAGLVHCGLSDALWKNRREKHTKKTAKMQILPKLRIQKNPLSGMVTPGEVLGVTPGVSSGDPVCGLPAQRFDKPFHTSA